MKTKASAFIALLAVGCLPQLAAAEPSALATLEPRVRERVSCSIQAAARFAVPANLLIAVAEQEGGRVGQRVQNTNGTFDVGPMQFNTAYLRTLASFGITSEDVAASGCYPYELAAWRLQRHLHRSDGDLWSRAANYHSRTPDLNARYRAAIRTRAAKWGKWLSDHVPTVEIAEVAPAQAPTPPPLPTSHTEATSRGAEPRPRTAPLEPRPRRHGARSAGRSAPDRQPAPNVQAPTSVVEELAALEARRRSQLLGLVTLPLARALPPGSDGPEQSSAPVQPTSAKRARAAPR